MENILEQLAASARARVRAAIEVTSRSEMAALAQQLVREAGDQAAAFPFEKALRRPGLSFICECKKASPSKGLIAPDYPYVEIASAYEAAGADSISVLTSHEGFLGHEDHLREIARSVSIPCLRKDFTVDEYMIHEARVLGASAVLLICSILSAPQLREYLEICQELRLSALVEAHDEQEVAMAAEAGARIIGVNNRNLKDFSVDTENSRRLRKLVPEGILFVSESGVKNGDDADALRNSSVDAVLVGEALMRANDKRTKLAELRGERK